MPANASYDDWFDVPGGDDFEDVTDLFAAAGHDMDPEEVILMDKFTLMDAMSAFEIGEPRLDSGMILEEQRRPPFDPLTPLLPEEVCWLLDRSFACEMEWHAGKTFSQSVFTLLFVHHLPDINPEYLAPEEDGDPERPRWLVTVILRAAILGLLKCCDLAWRELSKNKVYDVEDWQGEKCDVSLLEGIDSVIVVNMIDAACEWLRQSDLADAHIEALRDRLLLRKSLLHLYRLDLLKDTSDLGYHVAVARALLHRVRTFQPTLPEGSPVTLAVDPYIARRLPNFMPIRVTELPPVVEIWDALDNFLSFWGEIGYLVNSLSLLKWEAHCNTLYIENQLHHSTDLSYSLFYDSGLVLGSQRPTWLVEHFFYETIGIQYSTILECLDRSTPAEQQATMRNVIEQRITKLMVPHIRSNWYNPPRRRRYLMKEVLQWHMLYDVMLKDVEQHEPPDAEATVVLAALPRTAQLWRVSASREIILSGFEQELYAPEEKPIAYWYLSSVLEQHLGIIENLLPVVPHDTTVFHELRFQADHITALQIISTSLVALTAGSIVSSWRRIALNFRRRYKWMFAPEFDNLVPVEMPDLASFEALLGELLRDEEFSPAANFQLAHDIILSHLNEPQEWVGHWAKDRQEYLRNLADTCDQLKPVAPTSMIELPNFDMKMLAWTPGVHPWFPTVKS